jgi:putative Ca2+/H+ antiporter (TMEM165/GDT1 family)
VEAFLVSTAVVGLAEIGDKTQILSLMLAARFQRPMPIIFGILFATLANHAAAGLAGTFFGSFFSGPWMRWILGISFLSVAVWALFPDKYEGDDKEISRAAAFLSALCAFFFAEIGDKTQIATIGLAARFEASIRSSSAQRSAGNRYHVRDRLEGPLSHRRTSVRLLRSRYRPAHHHPRLPNG